MKVWSLSSGSSGNCYLVREGNTLLLMDAGLSVERVEHELSRIGARLSDLAAILVSHEHADHWSSAPALARRSGAPLLCSGGTWRAGACGSTSVRHQLLVAGRATAIGSVELEVFPIPHDSAEPLGFHLKSRSGSLCLATDMGTISGDALERALVSDLVILESNHDVGMVERGPYPPPLKARILGRLGHLSNDDAGRAVVRLSRGRPRHVWLAHLSRTNNSPGVALSTVQAELRRAGAASLRVDVALRDRRSLYWDSEVTQSTQQMRLF